MHSHGIAHRDLKPEYALMSDDSANAVAKIADLGLAKIMGPKEQGESAFGTLVSKSYLRPRTMRHLRFYS